MNEIRVPDLLLERYNTHFLGLIRKLSRPLLGIHTPCSYSNNLASLPIKDNMLQRSLRVKIQNAINNAILADSEDRGVFVGGRRRNRKKKRNKNGKDRKKQKKNETKTSSIIICGSGSENDDEKPPVEDKKPLIEPDFCDFIDVDDSYIYDSLPELIEDRENLEQSLLELLDQEDIDPEKMPFGFFKKKTEHDELKDDTPTEEHKEVQTEVKTEDIKQEENTEKRSNPFDKEPEAEKVPAGEGSNPDEDGTTEVKIKIEEQPKEEQKPEVDGPKMKGIELDELDECIITDLTVHRLEMDNASVVTEQPKGKTDTSPKEKSPLINKEERECPSLLCCTIL